jgi:hypothetical protein
LGNGHGESTETKIIGFDENKNKISGNEGILLTSYG